MDILSSLAIITLAGLVHATFQLSVSVLTLLGSHAIGAKHSRARVLRLTFGFVAGVKVMTLLLVVLTAYIFARVFEGHTPLLAWAIACGLLAGVGLAVWLFYYRREKGTTLWIPRSFARFLADRTKATKSGAEAFSLGLTSVIAELMFIAAPVIVSGLVIVQLPGLWQLVGVAVYLVASLLTLLSVWVLIGSGHKLGGIQKWRESNKYFLQFVGGSGLVILGFFVYVHQILGQTAGGL